MAGILLFKRLAGSHMLRFLTRQPEPLPLIESAESVNQTRDLARSLAPVRFPHQYTHVGMAGRRIS